MFIVFLVLHF